MAVSVPYSSRVALTARNQNPMWPTLPVSVPYSSGVALTAALSKWPAGCSRRFQSPTHRELP